MTEERANEIVRKVFYANFRILPRIDNSEQAFNVGRMLGIMQKVLEIELAKEIKNDMVCEGSETDADISMVVGEKKKDKEKV